MNIDKTRWAVFHKYVLYEVFIRPNTESALFPSCGKLVICLRVFLLKIFLLKKNYIDAGFKINLMFGTVIYLLKKFC